MKDGHRFGLLAGPYETHFDAISKLREAIDVACERDPWAWFYRYGNGQDEGFLPSARTVREVVMMIRLSRREPAYRSGRTEYRVVWEICLHAASACEAAKTAQAIQRDPDSIATVYEVTRSGSLKAQTIDLNQPYRGRSKR